MSAPQWSAHDDGDLLELVAKGPLAPPTADEEWTFFLRALKFAAVADDGLIHPNTLRPLVRDHVAPRRIGAFTHRALSQCLVAYTGEWQVSDDTQGKNAGKPARVMRWIGGAL